MKNKKFVAFFIAIITILHFLVFCCSSCLAKSAVGEITRLQNTVVFVTFEKQGDNFEEGFFDSVYKTFETAPHSVKNYLAYQSGGKVDLQTQTISASFGKAVRTLRGVNYYKPRYKWVNGTYEEINEDGYDNRYFNRSGKAVAPNSANSLPHIEGVYREQELLREIFSNLKIDKNYKSDLNGDGKADSVTVITDQNATSEWGDVLWSHSGVCHEVSKELENYYYFGENSYEELPPITLGNANLYSYNLYSSYEICATKLGDYLQNLPEEEKDLYNVGLFVHETLHVLGFSDYYSYEDSVYEAVGEFDILAQTNPVPQNMLGYLRLKAGWLSYEDVLYINQSGRYTLPLSTAEEGKKIAKIILSDYNQTGEYFMAEFRSKSMASETLPYDGGLSGDGLIIYRVSPQSAYINSSNQTSSTDYGNMYGNDEVYVYRVGNPTTTKKVTSPLNISYSLLGNGQSIITWDGGLYLNTTYGNGDLTKTVDNLKADLTEYSETIIHYSNGENSGILFEDIAIDYQNQSISFSVTLPEEQVGEFDFSSEDICMKKSLGGKNMLVWQSDSKSGKVQVMAIRATNRLKELAEKGEFSLSEKHFEKQKYSVYKTHYYAEVPFVEKEFILPEISEDMLVFSAVKDEASGETVVSYLGYIQNPAPTFLQFFKMAVDPIYYAYLSILPVIGGVVAVVMHKVNKSRESKRRYK